MSTEDPGVHNVRCAKCEIQVNESLDFGHCYRGKSRRGSWREGGKLQFNYSPWTLPQPQLQTYCKPNEQIKPRNMDHSHHGHNMDSMDSMTDRCRMYMLWNTNIINTCVV